MNCLPACPATRGFTAPGLSFSPPCAALCPALVSRRPRPDHPGARHRSDHPGAQPQLPRGAVENVCQPLGRRARQAGARLQGVWLGPLFRWNAALVCAGSGQQCCPCVFRRVGSGATGRRKLQRAEVGLSAHPCLLASRHVHHPAIHSTCCFAPQVPACYLHSPPRLQPGYFSKFQVRLWCHQLVAFEDQLLLWEAGSTLCLFTSVLCWLARSARVHPKQLLMLSLRPRLQPDTLFYIFYGLPGDEAQLYAADELAAR